jgi:hypothetical protein
MCASGLFASFAHCLAVSLRYTVGARFGGETAVEAAEPAGLATHVPVDSSRSSPAGQLVALGAGVAGVSRGLDARLQRPADSSWPGGQAVGVAAPARTAPSVSLPRTAAAPAVTKPRTTRLAKATPAPMRSF